MHEEVLNKGFSQDDLTISSIEFRNKILLKRSQISKSFNDLKNKPFFLFGASQMSKHILSKTSRFNFQAIIDETEEKQGGKFENLDILSFNSVLAKYGSDFGVVIAVLSSKVSFLEIKSRLKIQYGIKLENIFSFFDLAILDECLFPYIFFETPEKIQIKFSSFNKLIDKLLDDSSKRVLIDNLDYRVLGNYKPYDRELGFFDVLKKYNLPHDLIYIDGGAYDGDTVIDFLDQYKGRFKSIYAFEPDNINFKKLLKLKDHDYLVENENFFPIQNALWSDSIKIPFNHSGNMGATIDYLSKELVQAKSIDTLFVNFSAKHYLIKFDLEGADFEAIKGARKTIVSFKPILMLSVYHEPDDIINFFEFIEDLLPNVYNYELSICGADGTDLILYAIPDWLF